ncbi:MAG: sigma-54 dependent transcriptional regulator [Desulfobacteraceae bacterium]|jgi:two-component system response regulator AtoC|nr:sigma-54 dependent transcriptional regulator [Desulfobacteraceae bacterium]
MISYSIFIIDDEEIIRDGLTMALEADYQIKSFADAKSAIQTIQSEAPDRVLPDLILLDIGLPDMSGISALEKIKQTNPDILVIMITAYEDVKTVISAMKLGAYDYIVKPIQMDTLEITIKNALETIRLRKEVRILQDKFLKENLPCFIGESDTIQDMMEFLKKVAKSPDTPILIQGETGTGKELIASAIHYRSPNFKGNFVAVNCAAIPDDLIESEIFGYEKGAFSGAGPSGKKGLIEDAANGTLFLDELGDLSSAAQAKLLRFLENGEFYRVGGTRKRQINTRIVSATNKNLKKMIEDGDFRNDLYFRIGVIKIEVPSLCERQNDIMLLARHYLNEFSKKFGVDFSGISKQAETILMNHNWTGNIRELKNLIERGVLIGKGPELLVEDLGIKNSGSSTNRPEIGDKGFPPIPQEGIDFQQAQEAFEMHYMNEAYQMANGNESQAAKLLNMNHHTFRYRRKKLMAS